MWVNVLTLPPLRGQLIGKGQYEDGLALRKSLELKDANFWDAQLNGLALGYLTTPCLSKGIQCHV